MAITSVDILNLSHSLKDICEVNCNTPECLSQTLKILLQYNLIQANLQFCRQLEQADTPDGCPPAPIKPTRPKYPASPLPSGSSHTLSRPAGAPVPQTPPGRLDIADPFLADHEE